MQICRYSNCYLRNIEIAATTETPSSECKEIEAGRKMRQKWREVRCVIVVVDVVIVVVNVCALAALAAAAVIVVVGYPYCSASQAGPGPSPPPAAAGAPEQQPIRAPGRRPARPAKHRARRSSATLSSALALLPSPTLSCPLLRSPTPVWGALAR